MEAPSPLEILVGPEDPGRFRAIAASLAPRLDYRLIADRCQGRIQQWRPPPSGMSGPWLARLGRSFVGNLGQALRLMRSLPPRSLVYSTGETWGLPMALAAATLRHRHFTHVVFVHRVFSPAWLGVVRAARNLLAVDGWICVTQYQAGLLQLALGPRGKPVAVVRQGVDTAFFDPTKGRPTQQRSYVLAVGAEMRNYALFFEAVRDLDAEVVVQASSAWMGATRCQLRCVPANVRIVTQRLSYVELRDLYAGAALLVVPLYDTPQAAGITTILEGMAMQKCIVATQSRGLPDALVDNVTGLVVPAAVADLQQAIESMRGSAESRSALGREGHELVCASFKVEDHATAIAGFLSEVAEGRRS